MHLDDVMLVATQRLVILRGLLEKTTMYKSLGVRKATQTISSRQPEAPVLQVS